MAADCYALFVGDGDSGGVRHDGSGGGGNGTATGDNNNYKKKVKSSLLLM
jgi:hypothetical protein